jgi:hypothetical protein
VELPPHPEGNAHEYDVAPLTGLILYTCVAPGHDEVLPVIAPGCSGSVAMVTPSVLEGLFPQLFPAVTPIAPLVAPTVTVIVLPVELPLQPDGNDQV